MAKKKVYILKENCGVHLHRENQDDDPVLVQPGQAVESAHDLCSKFKNKFTAAEAKNVPTPVNSGTTTKAAEDAASGGDNAPADDQGPFGKDVTEAFDNAAEAGVQVYTKNRKFTVVDLADGEAFEEATGVTKKAAQTFIDSCVEEEEDDDAEE